MRIAIIPARSGSKGVPYKNIVNFRGKALIAHTIHFALESKVFDRVIVSTDSEFYREIALYYGAEVPFLRPPNISGDSAKDISLVQHAVSALNVVSGTTALLQPTAPLRDLGGLKEAMNAVVSRKYDAAWSVENVPIKYHPLKQLSLNASLIVGKDINPMRQQLERTYIRNGQFYCHNIEQIKLGNWLPQNTKLIITGSSLNIDDFNDFEGQKVT